MAGVDRQALKLAKNQSVFRDANEHLERTAKHLHFEGQYRVPFVCECGDPSCKESVMLSISEYEQIRSHPTWFLLVAGHEDEKASYERIVEAERGYAVVEKVGSAGAEAARLDSRARASSAFCAPRAIGTRRTERSFPPSTVASVRPRWTS